MEDAEGIDQSVESFFGADAGEVPDGERFVLGIRGCPRLAIMFGQVDAQWQGVELAGVEPEVADHVIAVVVAVDNEPVEVGGSFVNGFDRLGAIRLDQVFQEDVVSLEDTQQGNVDVLPDGPGGTGQQGVGEADDVGLE